MKHIFVMAALFIVVLAPAVAADSTDAPTVNPGHYGWLGDFHQLGAYTAYPAYYDLNYMRAHNIKWVWIGHQWVVPYLLTDTCNVKEGINEFKHKSKIWYEVVWWGDHTKWGDKKNKTGFAWGAIPDFVKKELDKKGLQPGGGNTYNKTWVDLAANGGNNPVMEDVKKTIAWQLDTIFEHCGKDALYGVMLSEEEPSTCLNCNLSGDGKAAWDKARVNQKKLQADMTLVVNQLYDFVHSRYPWLKVAPGIYTELVDAGNVKRDANIMDFYPGVGEVDTAADKWLGVWGSDKESFVLLNGYGDQDRKILSNKFDKLTAGFLKRGVSNIGFFHPKLSLENRIYRFYDVNGAAEPGPYDVKLHADYTRSLIKSTEETAGLLKLLLGSRMPNLPIYPKNGLETKDEIVRANYDWYTFREMLLDMAYDDLCKLKANENLRVVTDILSAEGFLSEEKRPETIITLDGILKLEKVTKEYDQLPNFYKAFVPLDAKYTAAMRSTADAVSADRATGLAPALAKTVKQRLGTVEEDLRAGKCLDAVKEVQALNTELRAAGADRSWKLRAEFGNGYGKSLKVDVTISADYGNGTPTAIHSGSPFIDSGAKTTELIMYLPKRPAAIYVSTGKWAGALRVNALEISNSREKLVPKSFAKADHVKDVDEWIRGKSTGFVLSPWGTVSGVGIEY